MKRYYSLEWEHGATEQYDTYDAAVAAVTAEYPDAVIGHDGDLEDGGDRTLAWACEKDSINDGGQKAVAVIRIIE